jgi:DNA-binding GntR family transcriptional regulator
MSIGRNFLDKQSPVPLYHQLAGRIRSDIEDGIVQPGDLIGTEKEIGDRYGVSRATVRQALDDLARDGLLVRITGRGTFVATPRLTVDLPNLLSFTEEMKRRGIVPGSVLLAFDRIPCPDDVALELGCAAGEDILFVRRVRTGDETPIVLGDHFLAPFIRFERDDLGLSLYETIEQRYGIQLKEAIHTIQAGLCAPDEAELLDTEPGSAVLRFRRKTFSSDDVPVLFETGAARGDLYQYSVRLSQR